MGKRMLIIRQESIGIIFAPRGKKEAVILRVAGAEIPDDAKLVNFAYMPNIRGVGLVLESPSWSDLIAAGANTINGILPLENADRNFWLHVWPDPGHTIHNIEGYDEPLPAELSESPAQEVSGVKAR